MIRYFDFHPELIVEATSVCDRACVGCYAPNIVAKKDSVEIYYERPDLFLSPIKAESCLSDFAVKSLGLLSIRGGEPSAHPELASILLSCAKRASQVMVETHGRWLETPDNYRDLISVIAATGAAIKLSFDQMHGLSPAELKSISRLLSEHSIPLYVAITEVSEAEFLKTRSLCSWLADESIIYQPKVFAANQLIQPSRGVLGVDGQIRNQLQNRFSTINEQRGFAV
jgi:organic radical activating enzyme